MKQAGLLAGAGALTLMSSGANETSSKSGSRSPFRYCLNTATIRGQKLGIEKEIEIAAQAGYDGIEPWLESIQAYTQAGGKLPDLRKKIEDAGLKVEGGIAFAEWLVEDAARREKGLERAKREMELIRELGGKRMAAPPAGATKGVKLSLETVAERYLALLELGERIGVVPQLEVWGFSENLSRLGECVGVAVETGHPWACVLPDVFHLHRGGSNFHGLALLSATMVPVLHMNDYPAEPAREKIDDSFRCYPGDGVAPLIEILRALTSGGGQKVLSLELFNRTYWAQDPLSVARSGLEKMKAVVAKASGGA